MGTHCHQSPHLSRPEILSSHSRWLQRLAQEKDHNNLQLQLLPSFVWIRDFKCELTAAVKAFHKIEKHSEFENAVSSALHWWSYRNLHSRILEEVAQIVWLFPWDPRKIHVCASSWNVSQPLKVNQSELSGEKLRSPRSLLWLPGPHETEGRLQSVYIAPHHPLCTQARNSAALEEKCRATRDRSFRLMEGGVGGGRWQSATH